MRAAAAAEPERDGFRGYFFPGSRADRAMVVLLGDEGKDLMSLAAARWLTREQGIGALCLALRERGEDSGIHSWPLERVELAVRWLKARGVSRVGIFGMSIQAAMALSAAARLPELSFTLVLSPCDFVPWGFCHGRLGRARNAEWPSGGSAFSWRGQDLAFQPAGLGREEYWDLFDRESRRCREMHSRTVFDRSEERCPIAEECFIPAERIKGPLVLVGAEDDAMWDAARYIRRLRERLEGKGFSSPVYTLIYPYGTHLLVPQNMLTGALPLAGGLVPRLFASGRQNAAACRRARQDLEAQLTKLMKSWK